MNNSKAIIINGFARGGTNILWNILQSHPNICSPIYETNEIIGNRSDLNRFMILLLSHPRLSFFPGIAGYVNRRFYTYKLENYYHVDNRFKSEGKAYTLEEINNTTLCIKGVFSADCKDIEYSDILNWAFKEVYNIGIIRDGFSLCEGWNRRGVTAEKAGQLYNEFMVRLEKDIKRYKNYYIVDFNEILNSPFETAEKLLLFCDEKPCNLEKIRLKVKKTTGVDGEHKARYGNENRKYWFDRTSIREIIIPDISEIQSQNLAHQDREIFLLHAGEGPRIYEELKGKYCGA